MGMVSINKSENSEIIFRQLVKDHGDRIYNLALMKSSRADLAADISQETFIRVYKGLGKFKGKAELSTWIYRIALNVCHTLLKKEATLSHPLSDSRKYDELIDEGDNVEEHFFKQDQKQMIRNAIASLSQKQSDAITLFYLKEFQYSEVAEIMDIPINTLKSHLRRAKENLKPIIERITA